jgi:hypothetical protein
MKGDPFLVAKVLRHVGGVRRSSSIGERTKRREAI